MAAVVADVFGDLSEAACSREFAGYTLGAGIASPIELHEPDVQSNSVMRPPKQHVSGDRCIRVNLTMAPGLRK